jgi:phosphoserine phosphatase RsbU/P
MSDVMALINSKDPAVRSLLEENSRLKRAIEELTILNDLARAIGALQNPDEIMQTIIRRSLRAVDAEQGVITLVDDQTDDSMKTLVRTMVSSSDQQPFHLNQNLLGWMHINRKPLLISNPGEDTRFRGVKWDAAISTLLCVPLMSKSRLIGILTVYNKKSGKHFNDEDQRLLAIIAAQSAQIVENARLYEEEKTYLKLQHELGVAAVIQNNLLPHKMPDVPGYDIAGSSVAAQMVGGDYFDFIRIDDSHIAFCLGDVAGKGLSAALLMANLQATLRGQAAITASARECMARSNRLLFHSTGSDRFVTCFYGVLDTDRHELSFCNAGHDTPFLFSASQTFERLSSDSLVLGMMEDFPYTEKSVSIYEGDVLVVFSDGVTEAKNKADEPFGDDRLEEVIRTYRDASAHDIIVKITDAVRTHMENTEPMDDITLVVVKRR